jgi:hypothetical protein
MSKVFVFFLIAISTLANSSPEINQIRVVEVGTEKVVTSIHLTTDEYIRIRAQAHVNIDTIDKWVDIACKWEIPDKLDGIHPENSNTFDVFSDEAVDDTLFVTMADSAQRIAIPVKIEYAPVVGTIGMVFLDNAGSYDYGDTVSIKVSLWNINGLIPGEFCADSIIYTMGWATPGDTFSELIINGKNARFGVKTKQCFINGVDTIKIVVRGINQINFYKVSASLGIHTGTIDEPFSGSGKEFIYHKTNYSENGFAIYCKNGVLQFGKNITSIQSIDVINVTGEIVHKGRCFPNGNASHQYKLPSTLKNGFYVIKTGSDAGNSVVTVMLSK